jgi:RNA polymerase sigma-70 factor (ECF subfamily)
MTGSWKIRMSATTGTLNNPGMPAGSGKWLHFPAPGISLFARAAMGETAATDRTKDDAVVHRVLNGDPDAFEGIIVRYEAHVLRILKKHLPSDRVEEIAQETFIRAYRSLPSYRGDGKLKGWLSAIAVRTCYDFWRRQYRSPEFTMSSLSEEGRHHVEAVLANRSGERFQEETRRKEAEALLDWALDRLSPADRMVLELVYLEGKPVKEAAKLLGWSVANVKVRSFRSRKKLHKLLTDLAAERGME